MKYLFLILSFFLVTDAFSQARRNIKSVNTIDGLQANVSFNRVDGETYHDPISGADFTRVGNPPIIRGAHGRAVKCTGLSGDQLESTHPLWRLGTTDQDLGTPGIQTQSFCMGIWVNVEELGAIQTILTQFGGGQGPYSMFFTGTNGNVTVRFRTPSGSPLASTIDLTGADGTNFATNGLNYILLCWNSSTDEASLRINDGTPTTATVDSTVVSTLPATICSNAVGSDVKTSWVDNIRYWDRVLSSTEATAEYNNGEGPLPLAAIARRGSGSVVAAELTAPNAPSLATGTPTTNSIPLTITPAASGDPASSYTVRYGTSTGSYSTTINVGTNLTPNVTGLSSGTQYFFVATASNSAGTSANSTEVNATTDASGGGGTDTYTTLRNTSCTAGQTTNFTTDDGKADGLFECQNSDPWGNGDDGGIAIKTTSGSQWWIRQWPYSASNPIELDWYELSNNDPIGTLIDNLASAFSPNLFVRVPTTAMTLTSNVWWQFGCEGHNLQRLHILESTAQVEIHHSTEMSMAIGRRWQNKDCTATTLRSIVLGSPIRKSGPPYPVRDQYNLTFRGQAAGPAITKRRNMIHIDAINAADLDIIVRAHLKDAFFVGLQLNAHNLNYNVDNLIMAGSLESAGILVNGIDTFTMEDTLYYSDPQARKPGWDGTIVNGIAQTDYFTYGNHEGEIKWGHTKRTYGAFHGQYGALHWFATDTEFLGTAEEPFTLIVEDHGFLPDGTPIQPPAIGMQWGKFDATGRGSGSRGEGKRFFKIIDLGTDFENIQQGMGTGFRLESSAEQNPGYECGVLFHNDDIEITLVNHQGRFIIDNQNCRDTPSTTPTADNNTFKHEAPNPAQGRLSATETGQMIGIGTNTTLTGSGWRRIQTFNLKFPKNHDPPLLDECHGFLFTNFSLDPTVSGTFNSILIASHCTGGTFSNVTGPANSEMTIDADVTCSTATGGVISSPGVIRFDHASLGGTNNGDGTFTICN